LSSKRTTNKTTTTDTPPVTLDDHPFFGLERLLTDEQKHYIDVMWEAAKNGGVIFVEGKSGSGKTTLAVLLSVMAMQYGLAARTFYIRAMGYGGESKVGFRPGMVEKVRPYFASVHEALLAGGLNPARFICYEDITEDTVQENPIYCCGQMYMRGVNLGSNDKSARSIVLIDEAQNATVDEMRLLLTRCFDNSLIVVAGHREQIDLPNKKLSGFVPYIEHFAKRPDLSSYVRLTKSMRGEVAEWADAIER